MKRFILRTMIISLIAILFILRPQSAQQNASQEFIPKIQKPAISKKRAKNQAQKKRASDIFKTKSNIVCDIRVTLKITGKDFLNQEKNAVLNNGGTCFLVEFNGKHIITAAHVAKPKDEEILKEINETITWNNSPIISTTPAIAEIAWKEISKIEVQNTQIAFENPKSSHSLKNIEEDLNWSSTETYKNRIILEAELEKYDQTFDFASLKLKDESAYKTLQAGTFGDSDQLKIGDKVLTIGNPIGHTFVLLSGEIAHFHLQKEDGKSYPLIYTSEMVGFGNSGGPLFDRNGKIIGICVRTYSDYNPHFGIFAPGNLIKEFLKSKPK